MRAATLVSVLVLAVTAGQASATRPAATDQGSDRPPASLSDDQKTIWMTEWVACWRVKMRYLSNLFHIPVTAATTPQQAAKKLAKRAEFLLYETQAELVVASDGCRNGILWRYYHPRD